MPIRSLSEGKSRLAPVLSAEERSELVAAMLEDVLEGLSGASRLAGILVVTRDAEAARLARRRGLSLLDEEGSGLNAALEQATRHLSEQGTAGVVVVPGDVPLVTGEELDDVLGRHAAAPAVTVVSDREGEGTNCLVCSPPCVIRYRFGLGSASAHARAGEDAGTRVCRLQSPGLGLDVDTPADLAELLELGEGTRSQAVLVAHDLAARLQSVATTGGTR